MKIGLTLGKYAPLHRGHQFVIEAALSEVDHLIVLIYDAPEVTSCQLPVRANWIRRLYPQVEVVESWDGPTTVSDDPQVTRLHDEYLTQKFQDRPITHFFCSEFYGGHVSRALGAEDRRIDPDRRRITISGTQIRQDFVRYRDQLDPVVYRDLVIRVVMLGAPSTGKSTLAQRLAGEYRTEWMPEYGREYWEAHQVDRRLTLQQLVDIAVEHRRREDILASAANRFLFVDTDATTTLQFSFDYHDAAHQDLVAMADAARLRYDLFFLCEPDIPYDDTTDRSGEQHRQVMQRKIEADLLARRIPFVRMRGDLESRVQTARQLLDNWNKFDSTGDQLLKLGRQPAD